jgi:ankyrin repeat protein
LQAIPEDSASAVIIVDNLNDLMVPERFWYNNDPATGGSLLLIHGGVHDSMALNKIMEHQSLIASIRDENGNTALHAHIVHGDARNQQHITELLQAGVSVNAINNDGQTAIMVAVETNQWDIVNHLLAIPGIDPQLADSHGRNLLHVAFDNDANDDDDDDDDDNYDNDPEQDCIRSLLEEHGLDPSHGDDEGSTLLHIAAENWNLKLIRLLLGYQADLLSYRDRFGATPLDRALAGHDEPFNIIDDDQHQNDDDHSIRLYYFDDINASVEQIGEQLQLDEGVHDNDHPNDDEELETEEKEDDEEKETKKKEDDKKRMSITNFFGPTADKKNPTKEKDDASTKPQLSHDCMTLNNTNANGLTYVSVC